MKRIITLILLFIPFLLQGQEIQQNFYGLKIGKRYSSEKVKSVLLKRSPYADISQVGKITEITALDMEFGSKKWEITKCSLVKNKKLASISFQQHFESYEKCKKFKNEILSLLITKYGEPSSLFQDDMIDMLEKAEKQGVHPMNNHQWVDSNRMSIVLSQIYGESKGGDSFYYVILEYKHMDFEKDLANPVLDEL